MEEFARCGGDYVATLLVERPLELLVGAVVVGVWRWFIGREISDLKKQVADMRKDADDLNKRLDLPKQSPPLFQVGGNFSIDNSTTINQVPQSEVESITDPEIQVIHYGTKHGDLSVRFFSVEQASEDILRWLEKTGIRAGVSADTFRGVLKRIQSNRQ